MCSKILKFVNVVSLPPTANQFSSTETMSSSETLSDLVSSQTCLNYAVIVCLMLVHILADRKYISVGKERPDAQYCLCTDPKPEKKGGNKHAICSRCEKSIKDFNPSVYLAASITCCVALPWIVGVYVTFIESKFGPKLERSDVDDISAGSLVIVVIVTALRFLFRHCNSISRQLAKSPQNTECNTARLVRYAAQKNARRKENRTFSNRSFLEPCVLSPVEQWFVFAFAVSISILPIFATISLGLIPAVCLMCIACINPGIIEKFLLHSFDVKRFFNHKPNKAQTIIFLVDALEKETDPEKREVLLKCLCELKKASEKGQISPAKEAKEEPKSEDVKEKLAEKTKQHQKLRAKILRSKIEALNSELDTVVTQMSQMSSQTTVNA